MKVDWLTDALVFQIRSLEKREGRPAVAVRVGIPEADVMRVGRALRVALPGVELEVVVHEGRPQVLALSFALETR